MMEEEKETAPPAALEPRFKLEAALAGMSDALYICDAQGRLVDINDTFVTFHRFRSRAESRRSLPEYLEILEARLPGGGLASLSQWPGSRALRGERGTSVEYCMRRKDTGEEWIASYSFAPIRDRDGAIVGAVVTGRDVTEQRRIEEALQRQQAELEELVNERTAALQDAEAAAEAAIRAEELLRRSEARQRFLLRLSETLRPLADPEEIKTAATRLLGEHLKADRAYYAELDPGDERVFTRRDYYASDRMPSIAGRYRMEEHSAYVFSELRANRPVTVADVALLKQATPAERAAYGRMLVRAFMFCPLVKAGRLVAKLGVTQASPRLWTEDELALVAETAERTWEAVERANAEARLRQGEAQQRERLEALVEERTAALMEAKVAAEAASRAKSTFLANMSHEIRTPLNAIISLTELLRRDEATPAQQDRLGKILTAARHLLGVISDILDLSKIEAGKLAMEEVDFDLDEVLRGVEAVVGGTAAARGLALRTDVAGVPRALRGDPTRLAQALVNYLSNAIKFTEQGVVTMRGRLLEEDEAGFLLRFEVEDTGVGISEEQAKQLFAPFEQVTDGRRVGGTGLGLALNRRIAQLMGGAVGVESTPGHGSTFWLTARLGRSRGTAARPAAEPPDVVLARDHFGKRVLLAEDDALSQEAGMALLRDVGLAPTLARDGAEAVRLAQEADYDLILLDMRMPRLSGLEAARAIRQLPGRDRVPIVAMTANAFQEDIDQCLAAGMNDFVAKPIEFEALLETLLKWLTHPGGERPAGAA